MNCRQIAAILPELVAGEANEKKAGAAQKHLRICSSCAREKERYEVALCALAEPREMPAAPDALEVLRLPAPVSDRVVWRRAAAAAAAAALAAALVLAFLQLRPHRPPVARRPAPATHRIVKHTVNMPPRSPAPLTRHIMPAAARPSVPVVRPEPPRPVRRRQPRPAAPVPRPREAPAPSLTSDTVAEAPPDAPAKPFMVVAYRVEPSDEPSIRIRATDELTGVVTIYSAARDEAGREQVISIRIKPNYLENGG